MTQKSTHEQLLASLRVLVAESCTVGGLQSELDAQGITVKLRFDKAHTGNLELAKKVAALLAQETM